MKAILMLIVLIIFLMLVAGAGQQSGVTPGTPKWQQPEHAPTPVPTPVPALALVGDAVHEAGEVPLCNSAVLLLLAALIGAVAFYNVAKD